MDVEFPPEARDWPLITKTVLHIAHNPKEWRQSCWVSACGTQACVAGHAVMLSGHEIIRNAHGSFTDEVLGRGIPGAERFVCDYDDDGSPVITIAGAAQLLMGLPQSFAEDLFYHANSYGDIYRLLCALAAEDGVELPLELHAAAEQMRAAGR